MRWFLLSRLRPTTVNLAFANATGQLTVVNSDEIGTRRSAERLFERLGQPYAIDRRGDMLLPNVREVRLNFVDKSWGVLR